CAQSDKDDLVTLLGQFCNLLYRFQYDKAKEVVDEFRLKRLNTLQLPLEELSAWSTLIQFLAPLASADKCYMTLSFLLPRGFLRKEGLWPLKRQKKACFRLMQMYRETLGVVFENIVEALDEGRQELGPGIVLNAGVSNTHAYLIN
uniref:Uncharacterized protein n=1 Tax=Romanomermis culicivorax TaxID=13658 RepID=A0A915J206_ROMCU